MFFVFIIIIVLYALLIIRLRQGWCNLPRHEPTDAASPTLCISVVIPMRNEESHIEQILNDIYSQNYPREFVRMLVVDDHSTDRSADIVEAFAECRPNVRLLRLPERRTGKKAALRHALSHLADTELMITTDADCRIPPDWLSTIAAFYEKHRPAMIICPIMIAREPSFFARWQALELMSLTGSAAGSAAWKHPVMCGGANLAIERSTAARYAYIYESDIASGDDMMMMLEIKKDSPERIMYLKSMAATVETAPQPDLKSFVRQRNRWTSKSSRYTDKDVIGAALIVFFANLAIVASFVAGIFSGRYLWLAGALWAAKAAVDFLFLHSLARFWNRKELMRIFVPAQILYPFYIVWVGIVGNIAPVKWKNRRSKI